MCRDTSTTARGDSLLLVTYDASRRDRDREITCGSLLLGPLDNEDGMKRSTLLALRVAALHGIVFLKQTQTAY